MKRYFRRNADGSLTNTFDLNAQREIMPVPVSKKLCGGVKYAMAHVPGPHIANEAIELHRKLICNGCPQQMMANRSTEKCRACGCYLREKRKLIKEKCPNGLW